MACNLVPRVFTHVPGNEVAFGFWREICANERKAFSGEPGEEVITTTALCKFESNTHDGEMNFCNSLPPLEDKNFSIVLDRLEQIERTLKDVEANTRSSEEKRQTFRDLSEKVTVQIRASIISVGDIDTVKQEFSCDIYVSVTWKEPRLQGKKSEDIDWDNEWNPRIVFFNIVSVDKIQKGHRLFYEDGDDVPFARETYRIKGFFRENMELSDFPIDVQELTVTIMSDWTDKMVEFEKDMRMKDAIRRETFIACQEWHLCNHVIAESTTTFKTEGSSTNDYPLYHIRCHVVRKNGFYLWNVALIMFLICALSFTSFSVDVKEPADRLSVTLTLLLTAVAFKFVVSQSLPTISYLTILDTYVLSGLVFLCCIAVENAVAAVISDQDNQKAFDRYSCYIALGVFILLQLIGVVTVIIKTSAKSKILKKYKKQYRTSLDKVERLQSERKKRPATNQSEEKPEVTAIINVEPCTPLKDEVQ